MLTNAVGTLRVKQGASPQDPNSTTPTTKVPLYLNPILGEPKAMSNESGQTALEESVTIRQELKDWEKQFAAANDGRKAGREDIKKNPAIGT